MLRRLGSIFLISVLCVQLVSLGSAWSVDISEWGSGATVDRIVAPTLRPAPLPATALLTTSQVPVAESLVFVGDILLARNVEVLMNRHGAEYPLRYFNPSEFAPNPYVIGNFEASIPTTHIPTPTGQIRFSVPSTSVSILTSAGFNELSLGNNHSLDFGDAGFANTIDSLKRNKLSTFGNGASLDTNSVSVVTIDNVKVALIGINALWPLNNQDLESVFSYARRISGFQVVYVHWGEEYALRQSEGQRALAKRFIDLGADAVIGHHPHVTQGIELIDNVPVVYSLGNFLFDQYFSKDVQEGLAVTLLLKPSPVISLEPFSSRYALSQPRPMQMEDRYQYLQSIAARSTPSLRESILAAEIPFGQSFATSPKMAIINQ